MKVRIFPAVPLIEVILQEPEVGDKVWYVPDGWPIGILVTVLAIDEIGDYHIDEPVGHDLVEEDFFSSKEEAMDFLLEKTDEAVKQWNKDWAESFGELPLKDYLSLTDYRRDVLSAPSTMDFYEEGQSWPEKDRESWFSLTEAKEHRGTPKLEFEELYKGN